MLLGDMGLIDLAAVDIGRLVFRTVLTAEPVQVPDASVLAIGESLVGRDLCIAIMEKPIGMTGGCGVVAVSLLGSEFVTVQVRLFIRPLV
jgi:hypothetical protein